MFRNVYHILESNLNNLETGLYKAINPKLKKEIERQMISIKKISNKSQSEVFREVGSDLICDLYFFNKHTDADVISFLIKGYMKSIKILYFYSKEKPKWKNKIMQISTLLKDNIQKLKKINYLIE